MLTCLEDFHTSLPTAPISEEGRVPSGRHRPAMRLVRGRDLTLDFWEDIHVSSAKDGGYGRCRDFAHAFDGQRPDGAALVRHASRWLSDRRSGQEIRGIAERKDRWPLFGRSVPLGPAWPGSRHDRADPIRRHRYEPH